MNQFGSSRHQLKQEQLKYHMSHRLPNRVVISEFDADLLCKVSYYDMQQSFLGIDTSASVIRVDICTSDFQSLGEYVMEGSAVHLFQLSDDSIVCMNHTEDYVVYRPHQDLMFGHYFLGNKKDKVLRVHVSESNPLVGIALENSYLQETCEVLDVSRIPFRSFSLKELRQSFNECQTIGWFNQTLLLKVSNQYVEIDCSKLNRA